jgi:hypothetical protein
VVLLPVQGDILKRLDRALMGCPICWVAARDNLFCNGARGGASQVEGVVDQRARVPCRIGRRSVAARSQALGGVMPSLRARRRTLRARVRRRRGRSDIRLACRSGSSSVPRGRPTAGTRDRWLGQGSVRPIGLRCQTPMSRTASTGTRLVRSSPVVSGDLRPGSLCWWGIPAFLL